MFGSFEFFEFEHCFGFRVSFFGFQMPNTEEPISACAVMHEQHLYCRRIRSFNRWDPLRGRHWGVLITAAKALEPFRFLFLPARRFFSHFISLIIDSHYFPFVGPTYLTSRQRRHGAAQVAINKKKTKTWAEFYKNAS